MIVPITKEDLIHFEDEIKEIYLAGKLRHRFIFVGGMKTN